MYDLEVYPVHDLEGKPELEAELEAEASRAMAEARILCVVGARHSGFRRIIPSTIGSAGTSAIAYPQSATSQTVRQSLAEYPCNVNTNRII
jgi:hypothetical protein